MGMCCETRRPRRQRRWTSLTCMGASFRLLTRAGIHSAGTCDWVDAGRTPPTVGCRTRETERRVKKDAARPRVDTVRGETATRGAAVLRLHRRPAHEGRHSLPKVCNVQVGRKAVRREAASLRLSRRPAHVEGAAWLRVSHTAGMRSRSKRQTHSDRLVEDEAQRAVRPSCPAEEAIHSDHQTSVQRVKRSTSTARPVSSDRSDQLRFARRVSSGRRACHSNRRTGSRTKG